MTGRRNFIHQIIGGTGLILLSGCETAVRKKYHSEGEEWKRSTAYDFNTGADYALTPEMKIVANENINKYRKGLLNLKLNDNKGNPAKGFKVFIRQNNHHFDWGYSGALEICGSGLRHEELSRNIKNLFNCTTAKCYWDERWHQPIEHKEDERIRDRFVNEIKWGKVNDLRIKGHPLVWTVSKAIPGWMDKYPYEKQLKILEEHVRDLIRTGSRDITRWDLCNEMLWEPSLRNLPERNWPHIESIDEILTYLEPAVHWAKDENPHAIYSLNDYGLVKTTAPGVTSAQQRKRYTNLVNEMKRRGCAPDALGVQCHVAGWYSANEFSTMLDDLAFAGLPLQLTEFWAKLKDCPFPHLTENEKVYALLNYVEMIYTLAFAHPAVNHLTYWGNDNWFDNEGRPLKLYNTIYELIKKSWTTKENVITDNQGEVSVEAFYGDYDLIYEDQRKNKHSLTFSFAKKNVPIHLQVY